MEKAKKIILGVIVFFLIIGIVIFIMATTSGPNNPNYWIDYDVAGGGDCTWGTLQNVQTANDQYATCSWNEGGNTRYLNISAFGFSIPTDATINGILVETEIKASVDLMATDTIVQLLKANATYGDNYGNWVNLIPSAETTISYGNSTALWGGTWTPAEINSVGFGVRLQYGDSETVNNIISLDNVRITIYYTAAGGATCWSYTSATKTYYIPKGCTCYISGSTPVFDLTNAYCWS